MYVRKGFGMDGGCTYRKPYLYTHDMALEHLHMDRSDMVVMNSISAKVGGDVTSIPAPP